MTALSLNGCRPTLCAWLLPLAFLLSAGKLLAQSDKDLPVLEPGKPIERELAGGQSHSYRIKLTAGQYLHLVVDQRGIDVVLVLYGPEGKKLGEFDSPNGANGPEPLYWIVEMTGTYKLEVRSDDKAAAAGRYEARVQEVRLATQQDKSRVVAQKAFAEGVLLESQGTADSLRKSIGKYEESLPHWRAAADHGSEASTLNSIGRVYESLGETQKALDYDNQALPLERAVGDRGGEALTLNYIGRVYHDLGEKQKALDYLNQALPIERAVGNPRGEAEALNNIGSVYDDLGEKQKALEFYNQALPLRRAVGDRRGEATTLTNIGGIYDDLGEKQRALEFYNQALPLERAVGYRIAEAATLNNIGNVYSALGEKQKAVDYYNQALPLQRGMGYRSGEASTLNNIGSVYSALGEKQKALDYYNQALRLRRAVGDRSGEAYTLNNIGSVYSALGEKQKAVDYYNQALRLWRAVGDRNGEALSVYNIARDEKDQSNLPAAREHIEMALNIAEGLRTKVTSQELRASYFATVQYRYQFYIDLLMQMDRQDASQKLNAAALEASERSRVRSLLELLTEARADIREGVDAKLLDRERSLQQLLNGKTERQMRLLNGKHSEEQAVAVAKEIANLETEYQQVETEIKAKSPRYAALNQPQPLSAEQIQQLLDKDTLLLEYSLGDERSYLWAVGKSSFASYELPKRAEIETIAKRFYEGLTTPNQQFSKDRRGLRLAEADARDRRVTEAAANLSQMLLAPVAPQLGKKRLLVVADGALQYVPFAALPAPQRSDVTGERTASAPPLIVDHEIVNLPSASTLAVIRQESEGRKPAEKTVAVLADPVFEKGDERVTSVRTEKKGENQSEQPSLSRELERERTEKSAAQTGVAQTGLRIPRLPGTREEAERILAFAPANARLKALDFEASRATASSPELSHYRYVHFATHGFLNSANPELSGIVLSMVDEHGKPQNGFLLANEVFNLRLPAELVVLSACQTGLGKEIKGEGLVGLTRGFMYAGAPRVIVSLWSVNDKATSEMMARLYKGLLQEHLRPAAALRTAQIEMWKQKRWSASYYWAAFVLQGEWR